MAWQYTPVTPLLAVAVLVSVGLLGYLLSVTEPVDRDRAVLGLFLMLGGAAVWSFSDAVALSLTNLEMKVLLEQLEAPTSLTIVVGWFVFAADYTDREDWFGWPLWVLVAGSAVGSALVLTNQFHGLAWSNIRVVDDSGFAVLAFEPEPAYVAFVSFSYLGILAGIYALLRFVLTTKDIYRGQALALVASAVIPTVANVKTQLALPPYPNVDLSAIALTISGAALAFAIVRYRLLDVEPVARRRVVERMRDGYVVLDDDGTVVDLNPPAADLLGDTDRIGRDVRQALPTAQADDLFDSERGETELVIEDENGEQFVEARLSPLGDDDDSLGQLLVLRDVTDRRRVERRYQTLIENASDIIVVLDEDGTITYASPSIERVLGLQPETVVGADAFEFVSDEDEQRMRAAFEEGIDEDRPPERFEFRLIDVEGNWRVLEGLGRNLLDNPSVEGVVVNARDITERKQRQRELERQNERLDEFASVVSHDLRNPLAVARGRLELARETGDDEQFEKVEQAHERMETIIENLLALAREGETVGETEPVDLGSVAQAAWTTVETAGATMTVEDELTIEADADRLRQLLENLFRNSIEHGMDPTPAEADGGEDAVTVRVGACGDGDGFYVEDDGPGLPDEGRDQLFEFGHSSEGGTGFGLAIVKQIAEAHGWDVTASDARPEGTDHGPGAGTDAGGARFEFRRVGTNAQVERA